ncbi:uncharacterized protein LOC120460978 [Pimephales promelas]|uniref:uncharacterized protein LOC120460978 n=1 Tax=Pimephales promelas TaxID=90988 RepID=UPI001955935C|nr:uncharacterized protein LOC120460978 [Pimephales promelas]
MSNVNLVKEFISSPCGSLLDSCTKDQLFEIADHYKIELGDKRLKDSTIREVVKSKLIKKAVLAELSDTATTSQVKPHVSSLTFEQQERLLLLQLEQERLKLEVEREKTRNEQTNVELQRGRLGMMRQSGLNSSTDDLQGAQVFDTAGNLRLMPKFNERDPDIFFILFERIAEAKGWPSEERTMLLQCVLTGRAQEVFSALSLSDCSDYDIVKAAVLKAYELVPEAYRQKFRTLCKGEKEAHVVFARELTTAFNRWCMASEVTTFEELSNLIVLEQFKNSVPARIATYINEQKAETTAKAAELADDYILTHKSSFEFRKRDDSFEDRLDHMPRDSSLICNYCRGKGHWKNECPVLKSKSKGGKGLCVKPAGFVAPLLNSVSLSSEGSPRAVNQLKDGDYAPFISYGHVSLVGKETNVPVTILRDTGASESFILQDVLPFSSVSDTETSVLIRGIGLNILSVPLHKIRLSSELVNGEVVVGVRPSLPVEGVDIILGNNLAGGRVWPVTFSPPVVSSFPLPGPDESNKSFPQEQKLDPSLHTLFESLMSPDEIRHVAQGYFLQDGMLVRKWIPHGSDFAGDPILQVVVPEKYRSLVLESSHDKFAGHFGVRKTYDRILRHFFGLN